MNDPRIISPDTSREQRVPPGQKVTTGFPVLHYGEVPSINISKWTFVIKGLVEKERLLIIRSFPHCQV